MEGIGLNYLGKAPSLRREPKGGLACEHGRFSGFDFVAKIKALFDHREGRENPGGSLVLHEDILCPAYDDEGPLGIAIPCRLQQDNLDGDSYKFMVYILSCHAALIRHLVEIVLGQRF